MKSIFRLIPFVACVLAACGGAPTERVVGIVVAVDSDASSITEVAEVANANFRKPGEPIVGAQITIGRDPGAPVFESDADGKFEISTFAKPPAEKGSPRFFSVSAPGYVPADIQYLSFPERDAQYFLVRLKKAN